jgi:hypothetical protein
MQNVSNIIENNYNILIMKIKNKIKSSVSFSLFVIGNFAELFDVVILCLSSEKKSIKTAEFFQFVIFSFRLDQMRHCYP